MISTTPTAAPQSRKQRRRQLSLAAADGTRSPTPGTFPRVATAPANLAPSSTTAATTKAGVSTKTRRPSSPAFGDTSELDAQISTLTLIRAYGYGAVPGTPLRLGNKASGSRRRTSTAVHGARDLLKSSGTDGSSMTGYNSPAAAGKVGGGEQQAKTRGKAGPTKPHREPWMGPLDSGNGDAPKVTEPTTIERQELRRTKARRLATVKGHYLLSQVSRVLHRRDLSTTAQLLASARAEFRAAGDVNGASEADEALVKTKADIVMEAIEAARKSRDFDRLQQLICEALHYFAILARHGQVGRHDTLGASERRDADKRTYERLRHPHRLCREYALEDGRRSREEAAALTRKRMYADARVRLEDARLCFDWAGGAEEEMQELDNVGREVEVRENATCGDRLTEKVASKLQFMTSKDYSKLFSELSEAATAYEIANDQDGAKVVRLVTAALSAVLLAEQRWMQLINAFKERQYFSASQLLKDAQRSISVATKGLPFVSPSLGRAGKILSPPGGLGPLDIVAELAALDGLKYHSKSVRALEQGMLDKAQQLNTSAREVFEFSARCCTTSTRCRGGGNDRGAKGNVDTSGGSNHPGDNSGNNRPSSPAEGCTAAGDRAARGSNNNVVSFSLSGAELNEGEALLLKIRRCTSTPTNPDDRAAKPKARAMAHPGVRHRVEDLLDEVSETEDIITRKKALERGDKLMTAYWDTLVANTPQTKSGPSLAVTVTAVTAAGAMCSGFGASVPQQWGFASPAGDIINTSNVGAKAATTTPAARKKVDGDKQQLQMSGGALSPEAAETCLKLLADAREAYEGQGFALQADGASRLRAGLVADRCLAKAPALARPAHVPAKASTAALPSETDGTGSTAIAALDNDTWLAPWTRGGGIGVGIGGSDFEAARAAAREAEENYLRAGIREGALAARRTEMSLRGDEAMVSIAPLLQKRAYDAVVEGLNHARRLYTDAGPQGLEGLEGTRDPVGCVKAAAMWDGQRLKSEAVEVLRGGDVEASRNLCEQAQSCFSFVDREGLADATSDVHAAILMVTRLASGDAVVLAAEAALGDGDSEKAAQLLREAKSFYHHAQLSYENLVDQVTTLLEEHPDDLDVARKAMQLQDNINAIYDSRRDGQRAVQVELRLDCLAADASLDNLAQVVDYDKFGDARTLLSAAALVYERSADEPRLSKVKKISSLVGLVESASGALDEGRYADAEGLVAECLVARASLEVEQPLCLRPPDCALFQGGGDGAKMAVLLRVRAAGEGDRASALDLLEAGEFEAAERAAFSACERFQWWAGHHPNAHGGGGKAEEDRDRRQAVVRAAQELTARVAACAGKARAEGLTLEGRELKSMGDFVAAVQTLRSAAELFHGAGLGHAAAETRAEASRTAAEALMLTSIELHGQGKLGAIAENLDKAQALLREANGEVPGNTTETAPSSGVCCSGGDNTTTGTSGGGDVSSNTPRSPEAPKDGAGAGAGAGAGIRCHILEDLLNFRSRVAGDIVMRGVAPVLDAREYDQGLRIMTEAEGHYAAINAGRWMTTVAAAAAGKESAASTSPPSPKELVTKRAAHDGDRLRGEAASAIQKEKDPIKARKLIAQAEACMAWAGVDPFAAGAEAVSKDIRVFESRAGGDEICTGLFALLRDREFERAKGMLEEALRKYRQGDAFKQIADTRAVLFCVEREPDLCTVVVSALTSRDPAVALKTLEEARPVFEIAAELRSAVLREVAELMGFKHKHIVALSALCRAWVLCINGGVPAPGDEDDPPDPAVALDGALADVRSLTASGASVLDIPFDLVQQVCNSASPVVSDAPPMSLPQAAAMGAADAEAAIPESDMIPGASGEETAAGGDGGTDHDGSRSGQQRFLSEGGDTGDATDDRISGHPDRSLEFEGNAVVVDDSLTDEAKQDEGSSLAPSWGTRSSGVINEECMDAVSSKNTNIADCEAPVAGTAPSPRAENGGSEASIIDNTKMAPPAQAKTGSESVLESSSLRPPGSANAAAEPQLQSGSSPRAVAESTVSPTGTEQAIRHTDDGAAVSRIADDPSEEAGDDPVDGRRSFMSISTKSSEAPASVNSTDRDAAVTEIPGDESPPHLPAPGSENHGSIEDLVDPQHPPDDPQEAAPAVETSAFVEKTLASTLTSSNMDQEVGLPAAGTTNDDESTHGLHDEAATQATSGPAPLEEDDDDVDYDLDSDFGDESGDEQLPAETSSARGSSGVSLPTTSGAVETKSTELGDVNHGLAAAPDVEDTNVDDESDYPPDIDNVAGDSGSRDSSSSESTHGDSDSEGSKSSSATAREDGSDQSSTGRSKSATGSSSDSSSSGNLSISDSDDGHSVHDDSTTSSPSPQEANSTESPALEEMKRENQDVDTHDDDDDHSLRRSEGSEEGGSSSEQGPIAVNSAQSDAGTERSMASREDEPHTVHDDDGRGDTVALAAGTTTTTTPGSSKAEGMELPKDANIAAAQNKNHYETPRTATNTLEIGDGVGAAEGLPDDDAIGELEGGYTDGKSDRTLTAPAESELVEPEMTKMEDVYKPNLDNIHTAVDVRELKSRFSLMLSSSFSPPVDGSDANEEHSEASEHPFSPPEDPAAGAPAANEEKVGLPLHLPGGEQPVATGGNTFAEEEYGDEVYSAIGHNIGDEQDPSSGFLTTLAENTDHGHHNGELDATEEPARRAFPATAHQEEGGYQITQEEWDQHNTGHGGRYAGDQPVVSSSVSSAEDPAGSSTYTTHSHPDSPQPLPAPGTTPEDQHPLEQHEENNIGQSDTSLSGIGGGERQPAAQEGASGDTIQGKLGVHGENVAPTHSSEAEAAATEERCDASIDEVDGGDIGRPHQQQQPQRDQDESDDLYDIDDHGLSSSDDD